MNPSLSKKKPKFVAVFFSPSLISRFWFRIFCFEMEVSVIGNPQTRICRAELAYRELGFRFISGESRNRVSFLGPNSKWKEIAIRCSPRSVKCEAIVSHEAPFLKSTPKSRSVIFTLDLLLFLTSYKFKNYPDLFRSSDLL